MAKTPMPSQCTKCAKYAQKHVSPLVVAASGQKYRVIGATSPQGERMVEVRTRFDCGWATYAQFRGCGNEALNHLADHGVVVIGSDWRTIRDEVARLRSFPEKPLIRKPGWSSGRFALPNGQVFSPPGSSKAVVLFQANALKCVSGGTPKAWRSEVVGPLIRQHLASFMIMTALAPPLLGLTSRVGNYGFELVGEGGKGKSTLQQIMSSVAGGALPTAPGCYWITCNATANGLERAMAVHSDQPMILEEAALYAANGTGRSRGAEFKELVFRLADGQTKSRFNSPQQIAHRSFT